MRTARRIVPYLGFLVSGLFLWLALKDVDFHRLAEVFKTASYTWIWLIIASLGLFYGLKALRWQRILSHSVHAPVRVLAGPMMIGFAANNVLPIRLGELVRVYLAAKLLQASQSVMLATLVIERMLDLFAILFLLGVGLWSLDSQHPRISESGAGLAVVAVCMFLGLLVVTTYSNELRAWIGRRTSFATGSLGETILRAVSHFVEGLGILRRGPSLLLAVFNSLVQWTLLAVAIWASFQAVSIEVPVPATLICLALLTFAIVLPTAPGFFGAVELAFVVALKPFGISAELAIAAALYYHLTAYILVTITGLVWLHRLGYNWAVLRERVTTA